MFLSRPETRDQGPETRDQGPETRDQRPETRDQRPETRVIPRVVEAVEFFLEDDGDGESLRDLKLRKLPFLQ